MTERTQRVISAACAVALGAFMAGVPAGCAGRALVPNEADTLREQLAVRTGERDAALARISELDAKLLRLSAEQATKIDPEVAQALPALARIQVSDLSTARLTSQNTANLAVVIEPTDALGRFLQVTGTVRVTAAAIVAGDPPLAAGTLTLGPAALRERYRSSMMGTHYTLELPIEWAGDKPASAISVVCEFKDGLSGRNYGAAATLPVSRRPVASKSEGAVKPDVTEKR
jgi:hypothetical protein